MVFLEINALNKKTKKIRMFVDYVNKNPGIVLKDPIDLTAEKVGVSASTINRYSKEFGFKKYIDLKIYISNKLKDFEKFNDEKFSKTSVHRIFADLRTKIDSDVNNCFSKEQLEIISELSTEIMKHNNVNILYNYDGTFLSSLFRYELNRLGMRTVISKGIDDYIDMEENGSKKNLGVAIIFSDNSLSDKLLKSISNFKYKMLITRKIKINKKNFNAILKLTYSDTDEETWMHHSKYFIHMIFINLVIYTIKSRLKVLNQLKK